jgi:hypothetical protein
MPHYDSASYAGLQDWENAANDAAECIKVDKNFVKGASRLGFSSQSSFFFFFFESSHDWINQSSSTN